MVKILNGEFQVNYEPVDNQYSGGPGDKYVKDEKLNKLIYDLKLSTERQK